MSTLRVNTLQNTSTTDGGISIDNSGHVTIDGQVLPSAGPLSNRNLIINGAMQVAQRGTNATDLGATNNVYSTVDRFKHFTGNTAGRFTADAISIADLPGFTRALKLSCTTADTSIASDEFMGINQVLEGQDLQQLKKGTSDAEALILSFYVKGNAAATYTFEARDLDNDRINTRTFDVTTSWVKIEIPLVGDTTGAYDNDNGASLQLAWWLHAGSDYTSGTFANTNTWATRTQANRVSSSNDSFFDSTSRTFFITGVQLEVGSVATPFEHRSYGDELRRCERYYQIFTNGVNDRAIGTGCFYSSTFIVCALPFRTTMRANPTIDATNGGSPAPFTFWIHGVGHSTATVTAGGGTTPYVAGIRPSSSVSGTQGSAGEFKTSNAAAHLGFSAEL